MIRKSRAFAALLMGVLLLTACADLSQVRRDPVQVTAARTCHKHITIGGRFSIQYQQGGRDESAHGSFEWVREGDRAHVSLLSPLGQTLAKIELSPGLATLTPAGQLPRSAPDADALAASALGWPLPISGLRDWLQGCVRDGRGARIAATPESASVLAADGWHLAYPSWEQAGAEVRPKRIDLRRPGEHAATEIVVRLVIDRWQPR